MAIKITLKWRHKNFYWSFVRSSWSDFGNLLPSVVTFENAFQQCIFVSVHFMNRVTSNNLGKIPRISKENDTKSVNLPLDKNTLSISYTKAKIRKNVVNHFSKQMKNSSENNNSWNSPAIYRWSLYIQQFFMRHKCMNEKKLFSGYYQALIHLLVYLIIFFLLLSKLFRLFVSRVLLSEVLTREW